MGLKRWLLILFLAGSCFALRADINGDGRVDLADLCILTSEWMLEDEDCMANSYLTFDGSTGYITVPDNATLNLGTGDVSFCFWVKHITGDDYFYPGSKFNSPTDSYFIEIRGLDKKIAFVAGKTAIGEIDFEATVEFPSLVWRHIAITLDRNGNGVIYEDGVAVSTTDISATALLNLDHTTDFLIGDGESLSDYSLDDLRIYKGIVLNQTQVNTIYNGGEGTKYSSTDAGVASAAWNMDEGTGATITDEVGGLIGTFTGGVSWSEGGKGLILADCGRGGISRLLMRDRIHVE